MKSQRRLGKGLKDISHCFILPSPETTAQSTASQDRQSRECRIVLVVDDLYPLYSSVLVFSLGRALAEGGWDTLLMDGVMQFPRVSFMAGAAVPGLSISHFLGPRDGTADSIVQMAPRLKVFLPPFNLSDFRRLPADQAASVFSVIRQEGSRPRFVILRVPLQEETAALCRLSTDLIFLIPAAAGELSRSYERIKRVMMGLRPEKAGIVVVGAGSRGQAYQTWVKFCMGMNRFLGLTVDFLGFLPPMEDSRALLSGRAADKTAGSDFAAKLLRGGRKNVTDPSHSLDGFLKGIENILRGGEMTSDEKQFFN
ncbi:MAG: hypothetical protein HZA19_04990 [Nitrospirae bacterium]|nr:hypothetical protein [Nitrospirota bacterium]